MKNKEEFKEELNNLTIKKQTLEKEWENGRIKYNEELAELMEALRKGEYNFKYTLKSMVKIKEAFII